MISAVVGYITILLHMITCLHSCGIRDEEGSCKENIIMNYDALVCNIQLAIATNLSTR